MTSRTVDGTTYAMGYDSENRMTTITGGSLTALYVFDGDGRRVLSVVNDTRTLYVNQFFEVTMANDAKINQDLTIVNVDICENQYCVFIPLAISDIEALGMSSGNFGTRTFITEIMEPDNANVTWRVYYPGSGLRVQTSSTINLSFMVQDHLNSTALLLDNLGVVTGEIIYFAWGETRYSFGAPPTDRLYTGQYEAEAGLYFYNARWYDNQLGRFVQADTIIPDGQGVQAWDRYAYANNNPVVYKDPSGHCAICIFGVLAYQTLSVIYNNETTAMHQTLGLVTNWFLENGEETQRFGPDNSLTQEVMNDPGIEQFRDNWAESGYQIPYTWKHNADERKNGSLSERLVNGTEVFIREHVVQLGLSVLGLGSQDPEGPIDPVGGTIGSLDRISVSATKNGQIQFEVYNEMGWASGSRIPGTNQSVIQNRDRSAWGPGGTTYQYFYWYEKNPNTPK